jgi:hypothetical protein
MEKLSIDKFSQRIKKPFFYILINPFLKFIVAVLNVRKFCVDLKWTKRKFSLEILQKNWEKFLYGNSLLG